MAMQFYASPEQLMRDRSEYARKNIARSRAAIVLSYEGGVLLVTENVSTALHKVSEIYDRIGFCAVGRYNEFETLRAFGVRLADLRGYSYDRRDVTGRALANAYAQNLGAIFTDQTKPFEVEICVAEVGRTPGPTTSCTASRFDGSVQTEPGFLVIGGQAEPVLARGARAAQLGHDPHRGADDGRRRAVERRRRGRQQARDPAAPVRGGGARPAQVRPHVPPDHGCRARRAARRVRQEGRGARPERRGVPGPGEEGRPGAGTRPRTPTPAAEPPRTPAPPRRPTETSAEDARRRSRASSRHAESAGPTEVVPVAGPITRGRG